MYIPQAQVLALELSKEEITLMLLGTRILTMKGDTNIIEG